MEESKIRDAQETMDVLYELSCILNCGIDRETLAILVSLCEQGVHPGALGTLPSVHNAPFTLVV